MCGATASSVVNPHQRDVVGPVAETGASCGRHAGLGQDPGLHVVFGGREVFQCLDRW